MKNSRNTRNTRNTRKIRRNTRSTRNKSKKNIRTKKYSKKGGSLSSVTRSTLRSAKRSAKRARPTSTSFEKSKRLRISKSLKLVNPYIENKEDKVGKKLISALERLFREHHGCENDFDGCMNDKCIWINSTRGKKGKCTLKDNFALDELWNFDLRKNQSLGNWIKEKIVTMPNLRDWEITKLLGMGTVGTVFEVVKGNDVCALKVQLANTPEQKKSIENEVTMQLLAKNHAPNIYVSEGFTIDDTHLKGNVSRWHGIVMEIISKELDEYLKDKLLEKDLDNIGNQLIKILDDFNKDKFIHGDAIWFNIGITEKDIVKFIDYDRACFFTQETNSKFEKFKGLDVLRLILESYDELAAENQKSMDKKNTDYLRKKYLIPYAQEIGALPTNKITQEYDNNLKEKIEELWMYMYEDFCKYCKVKCLE